MGQPPLGLKRKAETPLGSPPEPGQVLQQQEDEGRAGRYKIRVKDLSFPPKVMKPFFYACFYYTLKYKWFSEGINKWFCSAVV